MQVVCHRVPTLGSVSILSWHVASRIATPPGTPRGYKIAGRLQTWRGKRAKKNYNLPGRTSSAKAVRSHTRLTVFFPVLVLLSGVIDVIEQSEDKGKIYSGGKIFFFSKMEASVKAAKFHSCVVGQPIDCKLTVIEQECTLLLRRVMALRSVAPLSCR